MQNTSLFGTQVSIETGSQLLTWIGKTMECVQKLCQRHVTDTKLCIHTITTHKLAGTGMWFVKLEMDSYKL